MTFRRRQFFGWAVLATVALLGGAWLWRLDYTKKISTDALDLIPADERAPELALVRSLASEAEARTMFFELTVADGPGSVVAGLPEAGGPGSETPATSGQPGSGAPATASRPAPPEAAAQFVTALGRDPAFAEAMLMGDVSARDALGRELFDQRFTLLFPTWLEERAAAYAKTGGATDAFPAWLARDTTEALTRFLSTPEAVAFQDIVPSDPLLLMPGVVDRLKDGSALVQSPAAADAAAPTVVWARLAASPLSEAGQAPAFAAIERAVATVRRAFPGFTVAYTGVNRFAAASRARIEHEVTWLNALSLAAVLAVAFTFIRNVHRGLHLIPVVGLSVLGAWVCSTVVFARLHIMVFVVGSLLTGVAIDYGFYLFMQPPVRPEEDYWEKVRRLAKPLLASCLTTVAGFALLLFSELPFIRQLGVFVGTGLICALGAAIVYFSTVRNPFLATRTPRGGALFPARARRTFRRWLIGLWIVALPGLAWIAWRDDIRDLQIPSRALEREDARIRALVGQKEERTIYLSYGNSIGEARAALDRFEAWLRTTNGGRTRTIGLSAVVPTLATHATAVAFERQHAEFPDQLRAALIAAGFEADAFAPFFDAYRQHAGAAKPADLDAAVSALHQKLAGPMGLLLHVGQPLTWFVTVARGAPAIPPPADLHTVSASQLQSLNRIFARYRQSALWLSAIGLAIVGTGVFLSYGLRDGLRIFAIPCGACLGVFGVFGWLGHPLNLFHLLGAFLGVCLTHNYSIFSATSAYRREAPPVSVRMSALTTAASFGVLALSGIPVVRALGSTVALMVVAALLVIEFEHLTGLGEKK